MYGKLSVTIKLLLISTLYFSCGKEPFYPDAPVILISIDTLRADRLSVYGYNKIKTVNIDRLAEDSLIFEHAYSHCPLTLPSHISVFTSLIPPKHRVRNNIGFNLEENFSFTLANFLKDKGYTTGGFVSSYVLRSETGVSRGFITYDYPISGDAVSMWGPERAGEITLEKAVNWIKEIEKEKFFLFIHFYEPHQPYKPKGVTGFDHPYDGEVLVVDRLVGKLVSFLKKENLYEKSIIVFFSDHGEGLGDHLEQSHGILLYRESLQVPLFFKYPYSVKRGRIDNAVALVDITPTVLKVLGYKNNYQLDGIPLSDLTKRYIYSETYYPYLHLGTQALTSVIKFPFHFIQSSKPELYNLLQDPQEKTNIVYKHRKEALELSKVLEKYDKQLIIPNLDEESGNKLAALGYLSGFTQEVEERITPLELLESLEGKLSKAFSLSFEGRCEEAIPLLEEINRKYDKITDLWQHLGKCYMQKMVFDKAELAFKRAFELSKQPQFLAALAKLYLIQGKEALSEKHAKLALDMGHKRALLVLADIYMKRRDFDKAENFLSQALRERSIEKVAKEKLALIAALQGKKEIPVSENPSTAEGKIAAAMKYLKENKLSKAYIMLKLLSTEGIETPFVNEMWGLYYLKKGDLVKSEIYLTRSATANPNRANVWNLLGVVTSFMGDKESALAYFKKALTIDPMNEEALYNAGIISVELKKFSEAKTFFKKFIEITQDQQSKSKVYQLLEQIDTSAG